jgi:pimeloyl-ACP methyl ester carboxylesterase
MKKLLTIAAFSIITQYVNAQQNCLPAYNNPVKQLKINDSLSVGYIEKGIGETILFIHGLGGNLSHWEKSVAMLSSSYHCIAIDLPGYGYSALKDNTTAKDQLEKYANVVLAFIKQLKLKNITLAGHSMGGQIAIIAALKESKNIKNLVLVAPAGFETFSATESSILLNISTPAYFKNQDETAIRASFKRNFYQQPADVEKLIAYRIALKNCTGMDAYCSTITYGIKGMLAHPVKEQLSQLKQPVLIVFGENDQLIPNKYLHAKLTTKEVAEEGSKLIKQQQLVILTEAGHLLQYEKPELITATIINFLNKK